MLYQDISKYQIGDIIENFSGQYEVLDIKCKINSKREKYDQHSICKWLYNDRIVYITWNKNCNFKLVKRANNENNTS